MPNFKILLYSSIYIAPRNSHEQTEAPMVRLAQRKEILCAWQPAQQMNQNRINVRV